MDTSALDRRIDAQWDGDIVPQITEYIRVPAKSPHFDPAWQANGHIERVITQALAWVRAQPVAGLRAEIVRIPQRTPLLFIEVPASAGRRADGGVMLYGHLDKQPEMVGWHAAAGPWVPRFEGGRLYGRGGADDGYAVFAALSALAALDAQHVPHARCVGIIETCEESGSYDLPAYLEMLSPRIGDIDLVVGLDSGCGDYERLWMTTSLRGLAGGTLNVEVLTEGVHSGDASGVVPSSFRIARRLLDRLEDAASGKVLPRELHAEIPQARIDEAHATAAIIGDNVVRKYPFAGATKPMVDGGRRGAAQSHLAAGPVGDRRRRAAGDRGRRQRAASADRARVVLRLPPTIDGDAAVGVIKRILESDPPQRANVRFDDARGATGWNAPATAPWLRDALDAASRSVYGKPSAAMGEGGTIPFMAMLGKQFPRAQFLITGVLGPHSNAHGPNEFLDVPYARKLTACVARVIAAHASHGAG